MIISIAIGGGHGYCNPWSPLIATYIYYYGIPLLSILCSKYTPKCSPLSYTHMYTYRSSILALSTRYRNDIVTHDVLALI